MRMQARHMYCLKGKGGRTLSCHRTKRHALKAQAARRRAHKKAGRIVAKVIHRGAR